MTYIFRVFPAPDIYNAVPCCDTERFAQISAASGSRAPEPPTQDVPAVPAVRIAPPVQQVPVARSEPYESNT